MNHNSKLLSNIFFYHLAKNAKTLARHGVRHHNGSSRPTTKVSSLAGRVTTNDAFLHQHHHHHHHQPPPPPPPPPSSSSSTSTEAGRWQGGAACKQAKRYGAQKHSWRHDGDRRPDACRSIPLPPATCIMRHDNCFFILCSLSLCFFLACIVHVPVPARLGVAR